MLKFIFKFIPVYVEFRSLYWVQIEKQMKKDILQIFSLIDADRYQDAQWLIDAFETRYYKYEIVKKPEFVSRTMSEIHRAQAMVHCMLG
jgi:hypothetical protein